MDRQLIEYLPEFMRQFREIKLICQKEQEQIENLWDETEKAWQNQFIQSSDEQAVRRWELMLGIKVGDTWTLEERRNKVLSLISEQRPFTDESVGIMLRTMFGEGNYSLEYIEPLYLLISVSINNEKEIVNVEEMLDRILPANLNWKVDIFHNKHSLLSKYTHGYLSAYTHDELRNKYMFEER